MNFDSPGDIRRLLARLDAAPRRKWGQNFMINRGARETILDAVDNAWNPEAGGRAEAGGGAESGASRPHVWEVGGGLGALTSGLVERGACLTVFEVDPLFAQYLGSEYQDVEGFTLLEGDVLSTWREAVRRRGAPDVVVGNLPYGIAQRLLVDLVAGGLRPRRIVCTVQKEVAERAIAVPGTKQYSAFTVLLSTVFVPKTVTVLRAGSFWPAPEVDSAILRLDLRSDAPPALGRLVVPLVKGAFASRRKKLINGVKTLVPLDAETIAECLESQGISPEVRGEALTAEDFIRLAAVLEERAR